MEEQLHHDHRKRMRKKLSRGGIAAFEEHEVLEMLLYTVFPRKNTNPLAHKLLKRFGSIAGVLTASREELMEIRGIGEVSADYLVFLRDVYARMTEEIYAERAITTETGAGMYASLTAGLSPAGSAAVAYLDRDGYILELEWLYRSHGKMTAETCRRIEDKAEELCARGILLMHNHKGKECEPSPDDSVITDTLRGKGSLKVWHVIVSDKGYRHI